MYPQFGKQSLLALLIMSGVVRVLLRNYASSYTGKNFRNVPQVQNLELQTCKKRPRFRMLDAAVPGLSLSLGVDLY